MTEKATGGGNQNPNSLANLRKFGEPGGNPQSQHKKGGNKPWSIRNSVRYLARQEIDQSDPKAFKNILPAKPTVAQLIAANTLAKATKADMRAVEYVTEQVDGKLAQTNINTDVAAIMEMSDDDLRKLVAAGERIDSATEGGVCEDGTAEADSSAPDVGEQEGQP